MPNICLSCYEIYRDSINEIKSIPYNLDGKDKEYHMCPKNSCTGEIIEVDELMLPIIIELNKKGYTTLNCCSGHYYEEIPHCYIMFKKTIIFDSLPKEFTYQKNEPRTTIENCFGVLNSDSTYIIDKYKNKEDKLYKLILLANIELLKWVKKLPKYINEGDK